MRLSMIGRGKWRWTSAETVYFVLVVLNVVHSVRRIPVREFFWVKEVLWWERIGITRLLRLDLRMSGEV